MDALYTSFMDAVKGNNIDTVRTIVTAEGFDINKEFVDEDRAQTTPLQYVTVNGTEQIIKVLLSQPGIVIDPVSILNAIEMRFAFIFSYEYILIDLSKQVYVITGNLGCHERSRVGNFILLLSYSDCKYS
jgi:hypothetical protein